MSKGYDPDHTVEHAKEKEKDKMWKTLKYVEPEHTVVDTEEIMEALRKIAKRLDKMKDGNNDEKK